MAVIVIDLLGDEEDGIVRVVDKTPQEKPVTQRKLDVPHTQLEIVPVTEKKVQKPKDRRLRKTNVHGSLRS